MVYTSQVSSIPDWISTLSAAGWKNPFSLLKSPYLHPTEALAGDYAGRVLVVLNDFAPAMTVEEVQKKFGDDAAWKLGTGDQRYGRKGVATNVRLSCALFGSSDALDGRYAENGGVVYANACFLLKAGNKMTGGTSGFKQGAPAFEAGKKVLFHTAASMPNLQSVIFCGSDSAPAGKMYPVFKDAHQGLTIKKTWHPNAQGQPAKQSEAFKLIEEECRVHSVGKFR